MGTTVRILILSSFLLILPTRATPPARTPFPIACLDGPANRTTVVAKKYIVLQRIDNGDATKSSFRLYDITIFVELNQDPTLRPRLPEALPKEFSTRIRRASPAQARENIYGSLNDDRPMRPML